MEIKPPTITDSIRWLLANEDQLSLLFEVEKIRFIKGVADQCMRQLIARGLIKTYQDGIGVSEHGRRVLEGFQALNFLGEV